MYGNSEAERDAIQMKKIAGVICGRLLIVLKGPWIPVPVKKTTSANFNIGTAQDFWRCFLQIVYVSDL